MEFDDIEDEAMNRALERIVIAMIGKVSLDRPALQDDARRATLDQKVGHRVETGGAGMNRQMQPRFNHGFLCHSDVSGSIDRSLTR